MLLMDVLIEQASLRPTCGPRDAEQIGSRSYFGRR